jgi:hypothetical protein
VSDFIRSRKLPFPTLITFILSLVSSGKNQGVDIKSGEFFKLARRSGLLPDATAIHRSAVTKARSKLPWEIFESLLADAVKLAYSVWPDAPEYSWHGMTVVAFDGSKYNLPASTELRISFDPESGLDFPGKGHYPQCLVSTAYDVFRRLPIARSISPIKEADEREDVKKLIPKLPLMPMVLLFDRGYPSYDLIRHLDDSNDKRYFVFRSPAQSTFKVVENFVQTGEKEAIIWMDCASRLDKKRSIKSIQLRLLRLESPDGTLSVLITNLLNQTLYSAESLVTLYFRRWRIEEHYRDEKLHLDIEAFHSQSVNGIKQELMAVLVMCVIARALMAQVTVNSPERLYTPQFKNAVQALSSDAAILTASNPELALTIFNELLDEIARVKYYAPKQPRKACPRVSLKPENKWQIDKGKRKAGA